VFQKIDLLSSPSRKGIAVTLAPNKTMFSRLFLLVASLSLVAGFAPQSVGRNSVTQQNALADRIFGMDLFAPKADQNNYGARAKKNIKVGELTSKSYTPNGLTTAEYDKIRKAEFAKKESRYAEKSKKAFKFTDYTEWYTKRGTDLKGAWKSDINLGHTMVKTKFDWSGKKDEAKKFESASAPSIFGKKAVAPKKK
jgi:hypothetical protein